MDWEKNLEKIREKNRKKRILGKQFRKNPRKKIEKKRIFGQTPFIGEKKFTPQNHSLFRSTSCFGLTKIPVSA